MPNGTCTYLGVKHYNSARDDAEDITYYTENGWSSGYSDNTTAYVGINPSTTLKYIAIFKIEIGEFSGVAESLTVSIDAIKNVGTDITIRWALCSSDANRKVYWDAGYNPVSYTDDNTLIDTGTVTCTGLNSNHSMHTFTIQNARFASSGIYYIYFWAGENNKFMRLYDSGSSTYKHTFSFFYNYTYSINLYTSPGFFDTIGGAQTKTLTKVDGTNLSLPSNVVRGNSTTAFSILGITGLSSNKSRTGREVRQYPFVSWNTSSGVDFGLVFTGNYDVSLYAKYDENISYENNGISDWFNLTRDPITIATYTVQYNGNGGNCQNKPATANKITSYTFDGWYSDKNGTGTKYDQNTTFTPDTDVDNTIYANWIASTKTDEITIEQGSIASRKGYEFLTWNTQSGGNGSSHTPGSKYTPSSNVTMYAMWDPNGLARIYTGTKWQESLVFVFDGTKWVQCIPWVFDGTAWKIGG